MIYAYSRNQRHEANLRSIRRKLNKHIAKLEDDLVAAKLAMRTQKAGELQRKLFTARLVRMRRAAEKNGRKTA